MLNRGSKSCSLQSVGVQKMCAQMSLGWGVSHIITFIDYQMLPVFASFLITAMFFAVLRNFQQIYIASRHKRVLPSQMAKVPSHHFLARRATKRLEVVPAWDLHSIRTIRADLIKRSDSFAPCSHSYPILIILGFYLYFTRGVYFLRFFFQSGTAFLAICYILELKSLIYVLFAAFLILELKSPICLAFGFWPLAFVGFWPGFHLAFGFWLLTVCFTWLLAFVIVFWFLASSYTHFFWNYV